MRDHNHMQDMSLEQMKNLACYLESLLPQANLLTEARKRPPIEEVNDIRYSEERCSYCGMPITGVSKEVMPDGRIRCQQCQATGVEKEAELSKIFLRCKEKFEDLFSIKLPSGIQVKMKPASEVRRDEWTESLDPDQIGSMNHDAAGYHIWIDYGISNLAVLQVLVYFFTLIWQNENWDQDKLRQALGHGTRDDVQQLKSALEQGMALWANVQYQFSNGEESYAIILDYLDEEEDNLKGYCYREYRSEYPFVQTRSKLRNHPFHSQVPIDLKKLMIFADNC